MLPAPWRNERILTELMGRGTTARACDALDTLRLRLAQKGNGVVGDTAATAICCRKMLRKKPRESVPSMLFHARTTTIVTP